ncbi:MAG TPA: acetolactate synthase small subunit [Candidatus Limnocylindrales bacterium]
MSSDPTSNAVTTMPGDADPRDPGHAAAAQASPADRAPTEASPAPAAPAHVAPAPAHTAPPARQLPGTGHVHRHVLVAIVMNRPGVLNRVASLMRARNFNIESLAVSHTDQADVSRMTLTLNGDDVAVEQAAKQLYKLIDVLKVQDVTADPTVEHELALVKVRATDRNRTEVIRIVELYKGRIVDVSAESVIVEATGTEAEIDGLVALLRSFGIRELVRTGTVVMSRGAGSIESSLRWAPGDRPRAPEADTQDPVEGGSSKAGNG